MKKRAHLVVTGRVQGVCFRMYTCEEAERLGLAGMVRNLPDGAVEVICEGEDRAVASLLEWCRKGPPSAIVRNVEVSYSQTTGEFNGFAIGYAMR